MAMAAGRSNMLPAVCLDEPHQLSNLHSFQSRAVKTVVVSQVQMFNLFTWPANLALGGSTSGKCRTPILAPRETLLYCSSPSFSLIRDHQHPSFTIGNSGENRYPSESFADRCTV